MVCPLLKDLFQNLLSSAHFASSPHIFVETFDKDLLEVFFLHYSCQRSIYFKNTCPFSSTENLPKIKCSHSVVQRTDVYPNFLLVLIL